MNVSLNSYVFIFIFTALKSLFADRTLCVSLLFKSSLHYNVHNILGIVSTVSLFPNLVLINASDVNFRPAAAEIDEAKLQIQKWVIWDINCKTILILIETIFN